MPAEFLEEEQAMNEPDDRRRNPVVDLSEASAALDRLSAVDRVRTSMELAAFFLEYAAYEMALDEGADDVSDIILMAAKLDQAAQRLDSQAMLRAGAHSIRKI
jgi:hypothetical protein